jgi:hypothetical protein
MMGLLTDTVIPTCTRQWPVRWLEEALSVDGETKMVDLVFVMKKLAGIDIRSMLWLEHLSKYTDNVGGCQRLVNDALKIPHPTKPAIQGKILCTWR